MNSIFIHAVIFTFGLISPGEVRNQARGLMSWMFTHGSGDWGSIPGRVIPKTQKMVLDIALLNTQHYKVWIKGKIQGMEKRSPLHLGVVIEKRAFGSPSTTVVNLGNCSCSVGGQKKQ